MMAHEIADRMLDDGARLLAAVKAEQGDDMSVTEGRDLHSKIREIEGWLASTRKLLPPVGGIAR